MPFGSYLSKHLQFVQYYYRKYELTFDLSQTWFSYEDQPLEWHFPVGVLFDMFVVSLQDPNEPSVVSDSLPWNIKFHVADFPVTKLMALSDSDVLQHWFLSACKEVFFVQLFTSASSSFISLRKSNTGLHTILPSHTVSL
jgi:autophagy-related protein 5